MNVGAWIGLSSASVPPHRRDAIARQIVGIEGQTVAADGQRILAAFSGFVRAINLLRALLAGASGDDAQTPITQVALTQAVMARSSDGGATLSSRCITTLETLAEIAGPGQIVMDLRLHSIISLESPEYAQSFQRLEKKQSGRTIFAWGGANAARGPAVQISTPVTSTQVLGGHWMPQPGPEREQLIEVTRRIVADAVGPLANVITLEAAARSERVYEMVRHIVERLPREQRETVTQKLLRALGN